MYAGICFIMPPPDHTSNLGIPVVKEVLYLYSVSDSSANPQ